MTPQGILEIAEDLAVGRPTMDDAVTAVTGYLAAVEGGQDAVDQLDLAERHGESGTLAEILRLHCTRAADVAASLHRAARQARYGTAA
jgi:hypothetical protein